MYPLQGGVTAYEPSGYSPSVLDPTLMAPSGGAYSPGTSFGGGISFYGTGATGGYSAPTSYTVGIARPKTTTASPPYTTTATATPAPFPSAPGTPQGAPSESPPSLNPLAAAGGATGILPHTASRPAMQPLNNNPYAASMRAYTAPVAPLAGIRAADQSHGGPTMLQGGVAVTSGPFDPTPLTPPPYGAGIAGAGGGHGITGNMPPVAPPPGPMGMVPFSNLVAYNGNPAQGNGAANRDNLQAQSPTGGQALQQSPRPLQPPSKKLPPSPLVPPPPPEAVQLGNPAIAMAAAAQQNPNVALFNANTAGILQAMQASVNRSITNADKFQAWVKEGQKKLDKESMQFLAAQVIGPQKAVDQYEKPGPAGLSLLEMSDEMLKDAIDARARMNDIESGRYDLMFQNKARLQVQAAMDANNIPVPGQKPEVQKYLKATRGAEIEQAMMNLYRGYRVATAEYQKQRETDALKKHQDILNGYHTALVNKAQAWKAATDVIQSRRDAFWKECDQARTNSANLDATIQTYLKVFIDSERVRENDEFRNATLKLSQEANDIAKTKNTNDLNERSLLRATNARDKAQTEINNLLTNSKKLKGDAKQQAEMEITRLRGRVYGLSESIKNMGGI